MSDFTQHLLTSPHSLAQAMKLLPKEGVAAFPLVDQTGCQKMLAAVNHLPFRACTPIVGPKGKEVEQDFEIAMNFDQPSILDDYQTALEKQINQAFALMQPSPYPLPFSFNDKAALIYKEGSKGITPHRDLLCFEAVIAILTLSGEAGFYVCDDREKNNARHYAAEPGVMILMRGRNFSGIEERPYHYVEGISKERVGYGLRYNVKEPTEKAR
ncbi:hypothetical protein [Kiloniella sp. EL199]|uniref:hypothetical protein n=1 Tax=Kiloniella sp. EL199 TaxID=2107581 RepID=UPI000EA38BAB|nr:hypothetical protein [Kiloniella sp. EL199]